MFAATGELTGPASPTLASALLFVGASIAVMVASSWLNRRPGRRRTGPAPSPTDVINQHQRLDVAEEHISDLHDAVVQLQQAHKTDHDEVIRLQQKQAETFYRLKRIEDRTWPTT